MGYLLKLKYASSGSSFCNLGEGLSCDSVNQSVYSEVMGIPMSGLGLLYFMGVLLAVLLKPDKQTLKAIIFLSVAFMGPSLYLSAMEFFVLKNVCILCETSKVIILAIIAVSWLSLKPEKLVSQTVAAAIILGLLMAGATYFLQSNAGPGKIYNEFAQCLSDKGYIMYGSITCASCARQRTMFGEEAFKNIKEIECDPRNPNNVAELCIAKNIKGTPTWIQEDADGKELYRFDKGFQTMEKLSEVSGCKLPD